MPQQTGEDNAKRARRQTERVIKSLRPPTQVGKLAVWAAPYVVGPAVEYGVRFAEEKGPELAAMGVAIARAKAPAVVQAAKTEAVAAAHTAREKVPVAAHAATQAAKDKAPVVARAAVDKVALFAQRVQERRRGRGARDTSGPAGHGPTDEWERYEERTGWEEERR